MHRWQRGWLRGSVLALAGLLLCPSSRAETSRPAAARPELRVDFVDVGQGDAALVRSPTGKTVLIDGGPHEAGPGLVQALRARDVSRVDLIVLTHRHADHLGGLAAVVRAVGVGMFLDAPYPHPSPAYTDLLETLAAARVPVRTATRGRTVDLGGGAVLTLLGPPEPAVTGSRSDVNANSVVMRLDYGGTGILFAADAEAKTEDWLLQSGARLSAQVLKVAHHGSRYSSTARFLRAVAPRIAVISVGAVNDYGHPAARTLAALGRASADVYRTDRDGTVTVTTDGARISVRAERGDRERIAPETAVRETSAAP